MPRHRLRLLVDESVPASVAAVFGERGHTVWLVGDMLPAGAPDAVVARLASELGCTLVTWNAPGQPAASRVDFVGDEAHGRRLAERYLSEIEAALVTAGRAPVVLEVAERTRASLRIVGPPAADRG